MEFSSITARVTYIYPVFREIVTLHNLFFNISAISCCTMIPLTSSQRCIFSNYGSAMLGMVISPNHRVRNYPTADFIFYVKQLIRYKS
jgi:hypothetical protein